MAKHTPGPWAHYDFGPDQNPGPYVIAQTISPDIAGYAPAGYTVTCGKHNPNGGTYWPSIGIGGMDSEEARANARLISAAPALLAACRNTKCAIENGGNIADAHAELLSALKLAE